MRKNYRVAIERQATTRDSVGQRVAAWTHVGYEMVSISPVSGREFFTASSERAEVTHKIYMWYGQTVAPKDRLVYGARVFDIQSVINIEEKSRELLLMCREKIA